jgi:peptidoglycan/LPS O-acetylase OafA/YrhL
MRFGTLDALRGVAAIFVIMHHFPQFFGGWSPPLADSMVDFFFVLSGFVLAKSYGSQVSQGGAIWKLTLLRAVRIYPLYLVGTLIGIAGLVLSAVSRGYVSDFHAAFWSAVPFALLMLPSPGFGVMGNIYPLNIPAWSLFFEMVANVLWFCAGRHVTGWRLALFVAISAIGIWCVRGQLGGGWSHDNFAVGFVRVAFSFSMGVLLFECRGIAGRLKVPSGLFFLVAFIFVALVAPDSCRVFVVLLFYPAIVLLAAGSAVGPRSLRVFNVLGNLSYPLYAIHVPFLGLLVAVMTRFGYATPSLLMSSLALVGLAVTCIVFERFFDRPVRRILTRKFNLKT